MDSLTELAKMLKERENPGIPSITTGMVVAPPPEIAIRLNEKVVLYKDRLIFSAHMLSGYSRNVTLGVESSTIEYNDTIQKGNEVILMPTTDEQTYYVLDKAVRL